MVVVVDVVAVVVVSGVLVVDGDDDDCCGCSLVFLTYNGIIEVTEQDDLHTGQTRCDGSTGGNAKLGVGNCKACRSTTVKPGSIHRNKHPQQYKCPHCVTTGSETSSKQILQLKRGSVTVVPQSVEEEIEFRGCCDAVEFMANFVWLLILPSKTEYGG